MRGGEVVAKAWQKVCTGMWLYHERVTFDPTDGAGTDIYSVLECEATAFWYATHRPLFVCVGTRVSSLTPLGQAQKLSCEKSTGVPGFCQSCESLQLNTECPGLPGAKPRVHVNAWWLLKSDTAENWRV